MNSAREGLDLAYNPSSRAELKAGTWRQELKQRAQKKAAYWIIFSYIYAGQTHLLRDVSDVTPHSGFGPAISISNQENAFGSCSFRSSLPFSPWGTIPNW